MAERMNMLPEHMAKQVNMSDSPKKQNNNDVTGPPQGMGAALPDEMQRGTQGGQPNRIRGGARKGSFQFGRSNSREE